MAKIAISAKENNMSSPIDDRFGRAPYFLIYDEETGNEEWITNEINSAHGVGPKVVQMLAQKGATVIIAPQLGQNALQAIHAGGLKAYEFSGENLQEIIANYRDGKLNELTKAHE